MGLTRYQAVRAAILELGPTASKEDIARYVETHHGMKFEGQDTVALYINMVNSKMSRKQRKATSPSSAMLHGKRP
jgi:hypothetical protein